MKSTLVGALGLAAIGVSAQGGTFTVTSYYSSCATPRPLYTSTVTGTITQTYCPSCTAEAIAVPSSDVILTTYTTVYTQVCSTGGFTTQTYTITAPCPGGTPGLPLPKEYVPPSFTVVTVSCNSCPTPGPVVVTTPIAAPTSPPSVGAGLGAPSAAAAAGPAAVSSAAAGPLAAPASPGSGSLPGSESSPKVVSGGSGGSSGPLSPPQYAAGNKSSPATPTAGSPGSTAGPALPKFTGAAVTLGRHIGVIGIVVLALGGFCVYL